jgi:hypothetical protein
VALEKRPDGYALIFFTADDSQRFALYDRVKEMGKVLSGVHSAVNTRGQLVQHPAMATPPELLESPARGPGSTGFGVELVLRAEPDQRDALKGDLEDHLRLWNEAECPEMTDHPRQDSSHWTRADR